MFDRHFSNPFDEIEEEERGPVLPIESDAPAGVSSQSLIFIVALGVVLIFGAFMGGMYFAQRAAAPEIDPIDLIVDEDEDEDEVVEEEEIDEEEILDELTDVSEDAGELSVSWLSLANQESIEMHPTLVSALYMNAFSVGSSEVPPELAPKAFSLGAIDGGRYDGYMLTQQIAVLPGLGTYYEYYYLLNDPAGEAPSVLVNNYAGGQQSVFGGPRSYQLATEMIRGERLLTLNDGNIIIDGTVTIPELELSDTVTDTDGRVFNVTGLWHRVDYPEGFPYGSYASTTTLENGDVIKRYVPEEGATAIGDEQFFFVREDGRIVWHDLDAPFLGDRTNDAGNLVPAITSGVPEITWSDGAVNEEVYYKGHLGGCGVSKFTNVLSAEEFGALQANILAGTATDGRGGLINFYTAPYQEEYEGEYNSWVRHYSEGGTVEEFMALRPFVYYQDSLGRYVQLLNSSVVPAAECGKPVIYLYPEREMDIDVYVSPEGGFSYTDPVYDDGWRVTAHENGRLTNRDDGKVYPYLFWEGRGGMYAEPENYWVVAQEDVHGFLIGTLEEMGLNGREIFDFLEFWEPRMQDAAYYKIGFHGNAVMDRLAPLEMSVESDSELRILMDYTELDAPIKAQPPKWIPSFERDGFTVVEWGGVLR